MFLSGLLDLLIVAITVSVTVAIVIRIRIRIPIHRSNARGILVAVVVRHHSCV